MKNLNPYITFDGNCEEAFNFYKSVFGGEFITVSRFKEMPPEYHVSENEKERLMHISLKIKDETILMGSDTSVQGPAFIRGNNISLSINAEGTDDADKTYRALSEGGLQSMPMAKTFWGSYFGMLTDKFGVNWMISA